MKTKINLEQFICSIMKKGQYKTISCTDIQNALMEQGLEYEEGEIVEFVQKEPEKPKRQKICNFCDFAKACGIPEGVYCTEEHHQQGKDKWQYHHHKCEYFKDSGIVDVYDLAK